MKSGDWRLCGGVRGRIMGGMQRGFCIGVLQGWLSIMTVEDI